VAVLADLLVRFGADSAELRKSLKTVEGDVKRFTRDVGRMKDALAGAFAVTGLAKAGAALGRLIVNGAEAADKLGKLAQSAGMPVEDLSKLAYAAELSDVSTEELGTSLARLSKNMVEAAQGSKSQAEAFARLGVEVKNADGTMRDVDDVLMDVADRFAGAEDGAGKAAIAQELFGRAGADLIPLLNQGSAGLRSYADEAQRLGLVVSAEAAAAADEFGDNVDRLKLGLRGLAIQTAGELAPALSSLADSFLDNAQKAGGMNDAAKVLAGTMKGVASIGLGLWTALQSVAAGLGGLIFAGMQAARGEFRAAWEELKEIRSEVADEWLRGAERFGSIWGDTGGLVGKLTKTGGAPKVEIPIAFKADKKKSENELKTLQDMLVDLETKAATFGAGEVEVLRYRFESGDLKDELEKAGPLAAAYKESILAAAGAVAELDRTEQATAEAMREFNSVVQDAERLYEETRTPAEKYADELERLNQLAAAGVDPALIQRGMKALAEEYDEGAKRMKEITRELGEGIGNVLEENLFDGFKDGTKGMLEDFGDMLRKMAAQAIAANILGALGFGPNGATGGGLLGLIGLGGARAEGGPVTAGKTYLVGERGAELFTPPMSGHIIPNDELARGAGGRRLPETVRLQLDERSSRMTVREYFEELLLTEAATR
jgi:methyl-accepting chemotaxis protein